MNKFSLLQGKKEFIARFKRSPVYFPNIQYNNQITTVCNNNDNIIIYKYLPLEQHKLVVRPFRVCIRLDGQGRKNSIIIHYYPSFRFFNDNEI